MSRVLLIGCGGVGTVAAHKLAQNADVFTDICIASRTKSKCDATAEAIRAKGYSKNGVVANITTAQVDADNVPELVALMKEFKPELCINLALPYQDLTIIPSIGYAKEAGMIAQAALCITFSPIHTVEYYVNLAKKFIEAGADEICLKDMAGIGRPDSLGKIVAGIKAYKKDIIIQYHSHAGPGFNTASILEVCKAGCDYIDCGMSPLSWGTGHADVITVQEMLKDAGFKVKDINMKAYMEVRTQIQEILGIQVNFAPVLDVNTNPKNPVIGTRSFGNNPELVSLAASSYARGLEDAGVLAVGKHFPGHGDTQTDSHTSLPKLSHSVNRLNEVELPPFQHFINQGLGGIMTAHLDVPALAEKKGMPATVSKRIITNILRNTMHFDGLVFTDGLAMVGAKYKDVCINAPSLMTCGLPLFL